MSGLSDVSIANFMTVKIGDVEIQNIESWSGLSQETSVVEVKQFNQKYARKLPASATVAAVEMTCSFVPSTPCYAALQKALKDESRNDFEVTYWNNASKTEGSKRTFSGIVVSSSESGEMDAHRTVTYSVAVDGALGELVAAA